MRIIITGANSGVGQATTAALAAAGHEVVLACRDTRKGKEAALTMAGDVDVRQLDLADLDSVRDFCATVDSVDILVNNAGVFGLPLTRTEHGFEAHIGTNHLGHFALTCLLASRIRHKVVVVTSGTYEFARLDIDDLNWRSRRYNKWSAYAASKLANMLFAQELNHRGLTAVAVDPGMVDSGITRGMQGPVGLLYRSFTQRIAQSPEEGARATVRAVTENLPGGTFLAPRGFLHLWGEPRETRVRPRGDDARAATQLWRVSEQLTGCSWSGGLSTSSESKGR
jgi:NAD(P)-dependent dehydrogenase (short-subunit alcohol dehydrogenase family)